ncbi:hypothetical protein EDC96DRAFT_568553 [Choanephora cucurbitarum]|nr:hypothetical protein EDC96DRAFT_568553 [Choanephora cucurbitarum]
MSRRTNVGKQSDHVDRPESNDCAVDLQSISVDWENQPRYATFGGNCAKVNRIYNRTHFSGAKVSNISERKIDMRSTTANGIEVALCEFKKNVNRNELIEQQGKCCRFDVALLEDLNTINISDKIVTTIWDCQGKLITIEKGMDAIYLAYPIGNVEALTDRILFYDVLVQGMITSYQWNASIFSYLINSGSNDRYSHAL